MYAFRFMIFRIKIHVSNSVDPDQTQRSAASDLGLRCLPWSQKRDAKLIWVSKTMQRSSFEFEPRHEKTCLRGFRPSKTQAGLISYRDYLEACNFGYRNKRYYTI